MRAVLNYIYEPVFLDSSHGYRDNRGCHTCLKQVSKWNGYSWCIEGGIKGFFDNVNHHILERNLKERIQDQQFIDLYWKLVKAVFFSNGVPYDSTLAVRVPQEGRVSHILSNIYLHELDIFVEKVITLLTSKDKKSLLRHKVNTYSVKYCNWFN
jgi:retron-type reverse transcriptase